MSGQNLLNSKRLWIRRTLGASLLLASGGACGALLMGGGSTIIAKGPTTELSEVQEKAVEQAGTLSLAFRSSSDRVLPAVVSIQNTVGPKKISRRGSGAERMPDLEELDPFLRRFFEDMPGGPGGRGGVSPGRESSGSGVIIDPAGIILTNNHVVEGGGRISVRLHDGRQFDAVEVKTDPNTDIAVIRIKASAALPYAQLADSDKLQVGDWVLALGQPFGLQDTVTAGIISAKGRDVNITRHAEFLQTDAAINPGNSGGPLVNLRGEVIGINTAISTSSGGFQGIGFAVPANVAKWVSAQLLKDGKVHRAFMGVGIQSVTPEIADQIGLKKPAGALVTEVMPDTPAAEAGLQSQDVIVEFAGNEISSHGQLHAITARTEIGSKQPLKVYRDGKLVDLTITLREQPASFGLGKAGGVPKGYDTPAEEENDGAFDKLGVEVAPLKDSDVQSLGLKSEKGVLIKAVTPGSLAAMSGLEPGMAILQVGKKSVAGPDEFRAVVKSADFEAGVLLLVRSEQGSRYLVIKSK